MKCAAVVETHTACRDVLVQRISTLIKVWINITMEQTVLGCIKSIMLNSILTVHTNGDLRMLHTVVGYTCKPSAVKAFYLFKIHSHKAL